MGFLIHEYMYIQLRWQFTWDEIADVTHMWYCPNVCGKNSFSKKNILLQKIDRNDTFKPAKNKKNMNWFRFCNTYSTVITSGTVKVTKWN